MAIQHAAAMLGDVENYCLNAGGDITCRGSQDGSAAGSRAGAGWTAGIVDPQDRTRLAAAIPLTAGMSALATSGIAERGEHIWRSSGDGPRLVQVSVQAPDIITADALATSILAGGVSELQRACRSHPVQVLAFGGAGEVWSTSAFRNRGGLLEACPTSAAPQSPTSRAS